MSEEKKLPNTLKFKYNFSDDYNPFPANGAYGGVCPTGEIIINFYLERHPLPVSITYETDGSGNILHEIAREPEDQKSSIVRYINTGVVLNVDSAKRICAWLQDQISSAEKMALEQDNVKQKGEK